MCENFKALPNLLEWKNQNELEIAVDSIKREHLRFLAGQLALHAAEDQSEDSKSTMVALARLPNANFKLILTAPETCHAVYRTPKAGSKQLWSFLQNAILAEQIRCGAASPNEHGTWTANGDGFFRARLGSVVSEVEADYRAPSFSGIVFDTESPYAGVDILASNFRPSFGPSVPFTEKELRDVLFKCFAAVDVLSTQAPTQWSFVERMIATVMPRKDLVNLSFKGSSNRGIIGRANLINPHLENVDHAVIATSLVHEAIHILLYMHEEQSPFFESNELAFDTRIESPWSGNLVNLRAYIHGAFVWFGLYHFWIPNERGLSSTPDVRTHYLKFCSRGFRKGKALEILAPFTKVIRSDVWDNLKQMQKRMDQMC